MVEGEWSETVRGECNIDENCHFPVDVYVCRTNTFTSIFNSESAFMCVLAMIDRFVRTLLLSLQLSIGPCEMDASGLIVKTKRIHRSTPSWTIRAQTIRTEAFLPFSDEHGKGRQVS